MLYFKLNPSGQETVLYAFSGGTDWSEPAGSVILDPAGNLFGTTETGGMGYGVVFKIDGLGHETVLHTFNGGTDGLFPSGSLIRDKDGDLYGVTLGGGGIAETA